MRAVLAVALIAPSWAMAQTSFSLNLSFDQSNTSHSLTLGNADCNVPKNIYWSFSPSTPPSTEFCPSGNLQIWITTGGCGNGPAAGDLDAGTISSTEIGAGIARNFVSFTPSQLPIFADAGACGSGPVNTTFNVCGSFPYFISTFTTPTCPSPPTTFATPATGNTVVFNNVPPKAPVIDTVSAGDSTLGVSVHDDDATTATVQLYYLPASAVTTDGGYAAYFSAGPSINLANGETAKTITGLQNEVTYDVVAYALNAGGTMSDPSDLVSATPIHVPGFFEAYQAAGGSDRGGCSGAGFGLWGPALLVTLGLIRRRRT